MPAIISKKIRITRKRYYVKHFPFLNDPLSRFPHGGKAVEGGFWGCRKGKLYLDLTFVYL